MNAPHYTGPLLARFLRSQLGGMPLNWLSHGPVVVGKHRLPDGGSVAEMLALLSEVQFHKRAPTGHPAPWVLRGVLYHGEACSTNRA